MKKLLAIVLIMVLLCGTVYGIGDTDQPCSYKKSQTATVFTPKDGQTVTFSVITYQSHNVIVYVNNTKVKEATIELNEQNQYAYSYEWNGTLAGNFVPAGQYTVTFRYDIFFPDGSRNSKWDDTFSVTVKEPTATTPSTFTVDGYIKPLFLKSHLSKDAQSPVEVPLEGFTVEIRDLRDGCTDTSDDANSTLLARAVTDANGYFKVDGISNDLSASENGKDIFVKLRLDDSIAKITDSFDKVHTWSSNVNRDFKGSKLSFGTLRPSEPGYFSIWYWLRKGHVFYRDNACRVLPPVGVISDEDITETNSNTERLKIMSVDYYDSTIILHEYGHWIMYKMNVMIEGGGSHWIEQGLEAKIAYKEGWASFFACAVANSSHYIDTSAIPDRKDTVLDVNLENVSCYHNYLCPFHNVIGNESLGGLYGSEYEINTGAVLLDLYDSSNEGVDKITIPFAYINHTMMTNINSEAYADIYSYYDKFYTLGYAEGIRRKVWDVFGDRKVSHDIQVPTVYIEVLQKTPEGIVYKGNASDNIDIEEYTWLIDGREVERGRGYPGTYTVDFTRV